MSRVVSEVVNFQAGLTGSRRAFTRQQDISFYGFLVSEEMLHVAGCLASRPPLKFLSFGGSREDNRRLYSFIGLNGKGVAVGIGEDRYILVNPEPFLPNISISIRLARGEGDIFINRDPDFVSAGRYYSISNGRQFLGFVRAGQSPSEIFNVLGDKFPGDFFYTTDVIFTEKALGQGSGDSFRLNESFISQQPPFNISVKSGSILNISQEENVVFINPFAAQPFVDNSASSLDKYKGISSTTSDGKLIIMENILDSSGQPDGVKFKLFFVVVNAQNTGTENKETDIVLPKYFGETGYWVVDSSSGLIFATDEGIFQAAIADNGLVFSLVRKISNVISASTHAVSYRNLVFFVGDDGREIYFVRFDRFQVGAIVQSTGLLENLVSPRKQLVKMQILEDDTADVLMCLLDDGSFYAGTIFYQQDQLAGLAFSRWFAAYETYNFEVISVFSKRNKLIWVGAAEGQEMVAELELDEPPSFNSPEPRKPYLDFYIDVIGNDFIRTPGTEDLPTGTDRRKISEMPIGQVRAVRDGELYVLQIFDPDSTLSNASPVKGFFSNQSIGLFVKISGQFVFQITESINIDGGSKAKAVLYSAPLPGLDEYAGDAVIMFNKVQGLSHLQGLAGLNYKVGAAWDDFSEIFLNEDLTDNIFELPRPVERARFGVRYRPRVVTAPIVLSGQNGTIVSGVRLGLQNIGRSRICIGAAAFDHLNDGLDNNWVTMDVDRKDGQEFFVWNYSVCLPTDRKSTLQLALVVDDDIGCWLTNFSIIADKGDF